MTEKVLAIIKEMHEGDKTAEQGLAEIMQIVHSMEQDNITMGTFVVSFYVASKEAGLEEIVEQVDKFFDIKKDEDGNYSIVIRDNEESN